MCGILKIASIDLRRSHFITTRVKSKTLRHNIFETGWTYSFLCLLYTASEKGIGPSVAF